MKGQRVVGDRYRLLEELGRGGMAVVWRAHDTVLDRTVAVKLLAGAHASNPVSRERIRDEARAAATLSHPNIAQVHDYGESDTDGACRPYVVMELVRGGTLQQCLTTGPLDARAAMRVCAEVAAALAAAHAEGLVHRDIKPANVMVTPDGVKVVDFGVAAAISPSTRGGRADEVFGTPAYLAPERLIDDAVAPASDVYALGVLAYRMLSGHSPWDVETTTQMLTAHVYVEPEPLTSLPDVPDYVIDLINRCLAKDPTMRPSARDAAELLAKGAEMKVVAEAPATPGPAIDDQPSVVLAPFTAALAAAGNRLLWLVTAGVVVLAVLLWQVWPSGHSSHVAEGPPPAVPVPSATTGGQAQYVLDPSPTPALTTTHGKPPATATKPGESTPTAVPAPPTTGPAALSPSSPGVTFTSVGGIVRAACTAPATVHLESFVPTTGWKITVVNPGPRKQAAIIFKKGKQRVVQAYTCKKSIPSVQSVQS